MQRDDHAAVRTETSDRIAVRLQDARVREQLDDRIDRPQVRGDFEQPPLSAARCQSSIFNRSR
jgi:hypothetical protein